MGSILIKGADLLWGGQVSAVVIDDQLSFGVNNWVSLYFWYKYTGYKQFLQDKFAFKQFILHLIDEMQSFERTILVLINKIYS